MTKAVDIVNLSRQKGSQDDVRPFSQFIVFITVHLHLHWHRKCLKVQYSQMSSRQRTTIAMILCNRKLYVIQTSVIQSVI